MVSTTAVTDPTVSATRRATPRASDNRQRSLVTSAKIAAASAATSARDRRMASRHGRLTRIIPSNSRRLPVTTPPAPRCRGRQLREISQLLDPPGGARRGTSGRGSGHRRSRRPSHERGHQPDEAVDRPSGHGHGAERGQGEHGDPVRRARVGHDRTPRRPQRQVGQADGQVPTAHQEPATGGEDQLAEVRRRGRRGGPTPASRSTGHPVSPCRAPR